jgi:hypothetical protein
MHFSCPSSNSIEQRALEVAAQLLLGAPDVAGDVVFAQTCVRRRVQH